MEDDEEEMRLKMGQSHAGNLKDRRRFGASRIIRIGIRWVLTSSFLIPNSFFILRSF
jgi:hypothetical protein